jgi:hypothetical protein
MWNAVGQVLPAAVGVALSPIPIIGVVLMLVTPRGRVNGPMFLVGRLFRARPHGDDEAPTHTWMGAIDTLCLVIGVKLVGPGMAGL